MKCFSFLISLFFPHFSAKHLFPLCFLSVQVYWRPCYSSSRGRQGDYDSSSVSVFSRGPTGTQVETPYSSLLSTVHYLMCSISFCFSQLSAEVQFSLAHHIQAMVKTERNRQVLCNGGLISTLLDHCRSMLLDPDHMLHLPVSRILEKLTSQAISHADLR